MSTREQLIKEIEQAPDSLIEEVLDFLLVTKARLNQQGTDSESANQLKVEQTKQQKSKPIWEILESTDDLPEDVISQLPTDGAAQIDHYLYGKPKQEL